MQTNSENAQARATAPTNDPDVVMQSENFEKPLESAHVVPRDEFFADVEMPTENLTPQTSNAPTGAEISQRSDATGDTESSVLV